MKQTLGPTVAKASATSLRDIGFQVGRAPSSSVRVGRRGGCLLGDPAELVIDQVINGQTLQNLNVTVITAHAKGFYGQIFSLPTCLKTYT